MSVRLPTEELLSSEIECLSHPQSFLPLAISDKDARQDTSDTCEDFFAKRMLSKLPQRPWIDCNDRWKPSFDLGDMPEILEALQKGGDINCLFVAQAVRKMISIETAPPIQEILEAGLLPHLLLWMQQDGFTQLQFEAAWAFTSIASENQLSGIELVEMGSVPILITLLHSPNENVQEQAVWALGNLIGDSSASRDLVLQSGALPFLLANVLPTQQFSILQNIVWAIVNFCRGRFKPCAELIACAIPVLCEIMESQSDEEILSDCCWCFSQLCDGNSKAAEAIIETGVGRRLTELLLHPRVSIHLAVLRTFGCFAMMDTEHTQFILDIGALDGIAACLQSPKVAVRKEAVSILGSIAAGTQSQVYRLLECDMLLSLVSILRSDDSWVQQECMQVISKAVASRDNRVVDYLVERDVIEALCVAMTQLEDVEMIRLGLEALKSILRRYESEDMVLSPVIRKMKDCEGLTVLRVLQVHSDREVAEKAVAITALYLSICEPDN